MWQRIWTMSWWMWTTFWNSKLSRYLNILFWNQFNSFSLNLRCFKSQDTRLIRLVFLAGFDRFPIYNDFPVMWLWINRSVRKKGSFKYNSLFLNCNNWACTGYLLIMYQCLSRSIIWNKTLLKNNLILIIKRRLIGQSN